MSCPARREIDLTRYLLDPTASEFDAFRAHYPDCAECAGEVALWTGIETTLSQPSEVEGPEAGPWHPDVEALARYAGNPDVTGPEQTMMQRHLEACGTCRTEWNALQTFDFADVVGVPWSAERTAETEAGAEAQPSLGVRIASWLGLDRSPRAAAVGAFGAIVLMAGTWFALEQTRIDAPGGDAAPRMADTTAPVPGADAIPPSPRPGPIAEPTPMAPPEPSRIAATTAPPAEVPTPMPESQVAPLDATPSIDGVQLAQAQLGGAPSGRAVPAVGRDDDDVRGRDVPSNSLVVGDEILLASLSEMAPPDYAAPSGSSELAWMHQFGSVRGTRGASTAARVSAHAPDHKGLTLAASPRLWWSVSEIAEQPITITVVDDREIDPVLEVVLPGPQTAGLSSISLAEHGVELEPGVEYRWFVTLVNDPDRPSRNLVSAGSIQRMPMAAAARSELEGVPAAQRGHELARRGYWYDSYDFFAELEARHPEATALADHRARLLAVAVAPVD